ncbi:MAG: hypothetical protein AAF573_04220 [Bacteroidota bacterium]
MKFRFLKVQKVPKHKNFDYTPRYYDPKKEELMERVNAAKGQATVDTEATKNRIKNSLRRSRGSNPSLRRQQVFKTNMIRLVLIAVLLIVAIFGLYVYLP